jgi:beta-phosphoglucomutase-like phosphatase (HAD superfamily)
VHALILDLDGTLVDTVYAHVFAWQRALAEAAMPSTSSASFVDRRLVPSSGTRAVTDL